MIMSVARSVVLVYFVVFVVQGEVALVDDLLDFLEPPLGRGNLLGRLPYFVGLPVRMAVNDLPYAFGRRPKTAARTSRTTASRS
jgi:hypothetical protein